MKLYSWWRSQASFRVRIALHLKGLEVETIPVDIARSEHLAPDYRGLNPAGALPALIDGDGPPLAQSLAILEYLDERHPEPPLLPPDPAARAHARSLAYVVSVDAHPYIVPRVKKYLERELGMNDAQWAAWLRHWLDSATRVLEERLSRDARTGRFCCGDVPTLADVCLVPHVVSATLLFDADLSRYPTVRRIYETCMSLDAFAKAHPRNQPDTPIDLHW